MKLLQRIFDFYLDASIHVALAIVSLVHITSFVLQITLDEHLLWFLFFGSIVCYNFVKYGVEAKKYIWVIHSYHKEIQLFSFLAMGVAVYHAFFLNMKTFVAIGWLILLTGLYALPVLPKAKNLRSWGGLKIFIVAIVWAGATVILPVLSDDCLITTDVVIESIQRFILVFILLIPFEIRDLAYDEPGLNTLPQRYGVAKTKIFGGFATMVFFILTFLKKDLSVFELILKGLLFLGLGFLMLGTTKRQSRYFASFWVESIPILWWQLGIALLQYFTVFAAIAPSF